MLNVDKAFLLQFALNIYPYENFYHSQTKYLLFEAV